MDTVRSAAADNTRERIIAAAIELLAEGGRDAVSTRAVSAAAGVQAPTIYRLFGDKQGLLDAVASHGFRAYLNSKTAVNKDLDPVDDLRAGWDAHVEFGLANPALFALMYGEARPAESLPPAAVAALKVLGRKVKRVAEAGRLRVEEERATHLVYAAGLGTTLTLISMPDEARDPALSELTREAIVAAITADAPAAPVAGPIGAAVALRAVLPQTNALTDGERSLMEEWLDRIAGRPDAAKPRRAHGVSPREVTVPTRRGAVLPTPR
ncbi:TetR/AcrR family transcriptional regulator [Nocardia sp. NPDC004068]|uniref:TetR/AcrR family transcriptional regulator n=1 Tax=Nocardia sp. NPDC004068 TaxID=3364303 RepID=UPI00369922A1